MPIVPIRPSNPETQYLRCSHHPQCEGPALRPDHDDVCDDGDECTGDECWRGCKFCIVAGSEN